MPLVCANCGEKEEFMKIDKMSQYELVEFKSRKLVNYLGDMIEEEDRDHETVDSDDREIVDEGEIECNNCIESEIIELNYNDYEQWEDGKSIHEQKNFDKENKTFINPKGKIDNLKNKIMEE